MAIPLKAISLILGAIQAGTGAWQTGKGSRLQREAEENRAIRTTPDAILDLVGSAKHQAGKRRLPGQSIIEDELSGNTSRGVNALSRISSNPTDAAFLGTQLYANELTQSRGLGVDAAGNHNKNQDVLRQALRILGAEEEKNFMLNEFNPYQEKLGAASAMKGSGIQNLFSGVDTALTGLLIGGESGGGSGGDAIDKSQDTTLMEASNSPSMTGENVDFSSIPPELQDKFLQSFFINKGNDGGMNDGYFPSGNSLSTSPMAPVISGELPDYLNTSGLPDDVVEAMKNYYSGGK